MATMHFANKVVKFIGSRKFAIFRHEMKIVSQEEKLREQKMGS
tara:strand:+ start:1554 stop:1682 length:129 start_codon:yes stop_codon:yes gene_type:complete